MFLKPGFIPFLQAEGNREQLRESTQLAKKEVEELVAESGDSQDIVGEAGSGSEVHADAGSGDSKESLHSEEQKAVEDEGEAERAVLKMALEELKQFGSTPSRTVCM